MALTDDEKLYIVRLKFHQKLDSIETWDDFILFLENVTKAQIKTFIMNALDTQISSEADIISGLETQATDLSSLKTEIDVL